MPFLIIAETLSGGSDISERWGTAVAKGDGYGRALLVACDVMGFGAGDDPLQEATRSGLLNVLDEAALAARLVRSQWQRNDTGDGELALLPATESEPRVVEDFIRELGAALGRHNRHLRDSAWLRLRVAIHHGVAYPSDSGYAGQGIVEVSRLLDSAEVRAALRESGADLALIVSDRVFTDTVAQGHTALQPESFRKVTVRLKEFAADAWLWVPTGNLDGLALTGMSATAAEAPARSGTPNPGRPGGARAAPPDRTPSAGGGQAASAEQPAASAVANFHGPTEIHDSVIGINLGQR